MPKYVSLLTFTGQGVKNLKNTTTRAEKFKELAERDGKIKILETIWTIGPYDIVHIFEAPDDTAAASLAFSLNLLGTVRTLTMRSFTKEEMSQVLENVLSPKDLLTVGAEERLENQT
jgi:uncharacterized protein with GYD domain